MIERIAELTRSTPPVLADEGLLSSSGATVPTAGTSGYQTGCIFQHTDGGAGTAFYINEGTFASCAFEAVAGLTAAQEALLGATAGTATASKAIILDANAAVDAINTATLSIGASGSEVALTATPAEINALASAVSGLGSSSSYIVSDSGSKTLVAAHATKDRGVLVVVTIDAVFADGDGAQPVVTIGETDTAAKAMANTVLVDAAAGAQFVFGFTNTATKAITATLTAGTGTTETGALSILVIALPNS